MFKVYGYPSFNNIKVLFTAEELGVDYQYQHVALDKGEQKSPEHLQRNALGRVPVLQHNDRYLIESNAICRYLCNIHQHQLYSPDPLQAARIDQFIDTTTLHIGRWISVHFWQEVIVKNVMGREPDAKAIAEAREFLSQQLPYFDSVLSQNTYLCGKEYTLADVISACYFQLQNVTSFSFAEYPNITRWYGQVAERPALIRANQKVEAAK